MRQREARRVRVPPRGGTVRAAFPICRAVPPGEGGPTGRGKIARRGHAMYRIGIDAGSKTIKLVVLAEDGSVVHSMYRRHRSNIRQTLIEVIDEYVKRFGNAVGCAAVTGSAGIAVAQMLDLPFVQEVVADTEAVRCHHPEANAIIELGGEDAKVVYLDDPVEQRMNATCAGGTGGFIDAIAAMMGIRTSEMNVYAMRSGRTYPIASRCAVFAQSDVRPLINAGVSREDIAASVLDAVVAQTIGGLACGRPIEGTVVFLGGPLEYISDLTRRFRRALGLDEKTGIKPYRANLYTVRGAALEAGKTAQRELDQGAEAPSNLTSLTRIKQVVWDMPEVKDDLKRLEPLFADEDERSRFSARHAGEAVPRARLADVNGPLYLGIDMGSTTVKYALVDGKGSLVASEYAPAEGDSLNIASAMLERLYAKIPRRTGVSIAQTVVTGRGDEVLKSALRVDSSVVDLAAHARAAVAFCPDARFVLDIGGQDTKGMWIEGGRIVDAVLNEPCSGGYGAFVESTAASLGCSKEALSEAALLAASPVGLDAKCTVFMTSKVRHAQKAGAQIGDVAAGIAYSIAQNALHRVIGRAESSNLDGAIVVQGGAFKSDAVLRAFEKLSGLRVLRPDAADLMGAIGAALIARERAEEKRRRRLAAGEQDPVIASSLMPADRLAKIDPVYSAYTCTGCERACALSLVDFRDGRMFVRGNRCGKAAEVVEQAVVRLREGEHLGTTSLLPRSRASKRSQTAAELGGGIVIPGYLRSFSGGMAGGGGSVGGELVAKYLADAPFNRELKRTPSASRYTRHWGEKPKIDKAAGDKLRDPVAVELSERNRLSEREDVPNVVARQRQLLAQFGDRPASGARAAVTVGLVNALDAYEQLPFWHTLFSELGYGIAVSDGESARDLAVKSAESIPSESVCEPAKVAHSRVYDLRRKGADALFMPRFERDSHCAVRCRYAEAIAGNTPFLFEGEALMLMPSLQSGASRDLACGEADRKALLEALAQLPGVPAPSEAELDRALCAARAAQGAFEDALACATREALAWVAAGGDRHGVVLACRPYHVDAQLMRDADNILSRRGFAVLAPLGIDGAVPDAPSAFAQEACRTWAPAARLLRYADFVAANPCMDMVIVQSFNCGYDAVSIGDARVRLKAAGRPFFVLKMDEITDPAHIAARLEALAVSMEARAHLRSDASDAASSRCAEQPCAAARSCAGKRADAGVRKDALSPIDVLADGIGRDDLEAVRASMPPDLCFTAAALIAHAAEKLQGDPSSRVLRLPMVCRSCLVDALPHLLKRRFGKEPAIVWDEVWQGALPAAPCAAASEAADRAEGAGSPHSAEGPAPIRIGVVGNPLLCFDPFMNEDVVGLLESLGAQPILPDPALLAGDDVRYAAQLERFKQEGAASVLYLQSFGCLKGHVHARGMLRAMMRTGADMPVVALDYDPESSRLNRENRIRLVVAAAKRKAGLA